MAKITSQRRIVARGGEQIHAQEGDACVVYWRNNSLKLICCDCGLAHSIIFVPRGDVLTMYMSRNERSTAARRRKYPALKKAIEERT